LVVTAAPVGKYKIGFQVTKSSSTLIYPAKMFSLLLRNRQAQTKLIDKRVGLMAEIINNIRAVKLYAYGTSMSKKVSMVREDEMVILRAYGGLRSTLNALFGFIPVLAAVCKFEQYTVCHSNRQ
jgi:hypothetical protein